MGAYARALAACCVLVTLRLASGYTVDCNHEYADCDTELSKIVAEEEDTVSPKHTTQTAELSSTSTKSPTRALTPIDNKTETTTPEPEPETSTISFSSPYRPRTISFEVVKPKSRFLNINVDELQNFANALHNQTTKKKLGDLSDVNLEDEEEEPSRLINDPMKGHKGIPDKFYTNLQAPFHTSISTDKDKGSEELVETCRENEVVYKVGERIDHGCEETCECYSRGIFECSPRCKHPYIRRGRRLNDPLCFESPVDECCSIIACATSTGEPKPRNVEICVHNNETHVTGAKWHIGCEKTCTCEPHSIVNCQPRCKPLIASDKCINVQDPNDACCEVQVCDVSQDVHEQPDNTTTTTTTTTTISSTNTTSTTTSAPTTTATFPFSVIYNILPTTASTTLENPTAMPVSSTKEPSQFSYEDQSDTTHRPLVLAEPIGSVKVLQNNTVQVNLIHMNNSIDPIHLLLSSDGGKSFHDVELKHSNLILNLEGGKDYILKTRETGTKFNFTITTTGSTPSDKFEDAEQRSGCWEDDKFYAVGDEFHIGCSELCECTGENMRECAPLICPNHVGLELLSKGCVRWAPSPPSQPPNCCPRSARCLSDGTCHYNGVPVPNWSEVPILLTGCEQRCFCENGELDCQEVCSPLPPVPPQNLRCPPMHKPAAVNISDDDCCKQWACVPNAETTNQTDKSLPIFTKLDELSQFYKSPVPITPKVTKVSVATPQSNPPKEPSNSDYFYKYLSPLNMFSRPLKLVTPLPPKNIKYSDFENISSYLQEPSRTVYNMFDSGPPVAIGPASAESWETFKHALANTYPILDVPTHMNREHVETITQSNLGQPAIRIHVSPDTNNHQLQVIRPMQANPIQTQPAQTPEKVKYQKKQTYSLSDNLSETGTQINDNNIYKSRLRHQMSPVKWYAHGTGLTPVPDAMKRVPISRLESFNFFLPIHERAKPSETTDVPFSASLIRDSNEMNVGFFEPLLRNRTDLLAVKKPPTRSNDDRNQYPNNNAKQVTVLKSKLTKDETSNLWPRDMKPHVLTKTPNPYEKVLMNAILRHHSKSPTGNPGQGPVPQPQNFYSTLNLEHLLSQMEVESEVNRNLGRSADNGEDSVTAGHGQSSNILPQTPSSFLPTVSPDVAYPQEDSDYNQNNIRQVEPGVSNLPPGVHATGPFGDTNKKLTVISIESDSPTSIKMLLGLPSVLVGLRGSVDLRYTDKADEDISHWYSQVFAPADEVLTTARLEFRLAGLKPSTTYKIKGKLYLHNLPVSPESEIYSVRTHDSLTPDTQEKRREVNSRLALVDVNDTTAHVNWRHFTEDELMLIDGIQVRYRPVGTPIFSMTELLHHSRSTAELSELRPSTRYEASLVLIPPPRSTVELYDPANIEFMTKPYNDPYNWTVTLEAVEVGATSAQMTWRGVPAPAERWVRVYRAAHACGDLPGVEHDEFRLAARDQPPAITLNALTANSRCRIWLELFLTNGKVKTSNVLEITTKSLNTDHAVDNEIEASSISGGQAARPRGDYYTALVGVGVVAALGALTSLLLLLVVVRRHRPRSVPITPVPSAPRESSLPPYDNPAYKLELQQETMDL